jgi:hypothetical protein
MSSQTASQAKKSRKPLPRLLMDLLGRDWCGNSNPPRDNRSIYIHDDQVIRVFSTSNDGFEVGIGYPDQWHLFIRWEAAKIFAKWVLKIWIADWFGLRTHLWYVALHRQVKGEWKLIPYHHPPCVWKSSYEEWESERI